MAFRGDWLIKCRLGSPCTWICDTREVPIKRGTMYPRRAKTGCSQHRWREASMPIDAWKHQCPENWANLFFDFGINFISGDLRDWDWWEVHFGGQKHNFFQIWSICRSFQAEIMQNVFNTSNCNVYYFKKQNISANLPCQNNAECFVVLASPCRPKHEIEKKTWNGPRSKFFSGANLKFSLWTTRQKQAIANLCRECHCRQNLWLFSEDRKFVVTWSL